MPFSARQVRASLQRNAAVVSGLHGLGCSGCSGNCKGLGECYYDDATGQYDICTDPVAPTIPGGYGVVQPFDYSTVYVPPASSVGSGTGGFLTAISPLVGAAVTRLAVPQLNPGQSVTKLANGTQVLTQQAAGYPISAASGSIGVDTGIGGNGMLLLLGGLALVLVMGKKS